MKKLLLPLLVILMLYSCKNKEPDEIVEDLKMHYENTTVQIEQDINHSRTYILHQRAGNAERVAPYYKRMIQLDSVTEYFYTLAEKAILEDVDPEVKMQKLYEEYLTIIDSLWLFLTPESRNHFAPHINDYSDREYFKRYPELTLLMMKNDIALNHSRVLFDIVAQVTHHPNYFYPDTVFTNPLNNYKGGYAFTCSSVLLQKVQSVFVEMDTLLKDGEVTNFKTKVNPNYAFYDVVYDSLPPGNYEARGKAMIRVGYRSFTYPVVHKFTISDKSSIKQ